MRRGRWVGGEGGGEEKGILLRSFLGTSMFSAGERGREGERGQRKIERGKEEKKLRSASDLRRKKKRKEEECQPGTH